VATDEGGTMSWFNEQRQAWIAETVMIFGYINRKHIMKKFDVSLPQASRDLRDFQKKNPGTLTYDTTGRQYLATQYIPPNPEQR
jgi:hypothetical protein